MPSMPVRASAVDQDRPTSRSASSAPPATRPSTVGRSSVATPGSSAATAASWPGPGAGHLGPQLGQEDLAGALVLDPRQQPAQDAEGRGDHPPGQPAVHPLGQHVDPDRGHHVAPQRRGAPQPVVGEAARVEADHQVGPPDPVGQRLQVGGQVGAAALLAGLDEDHHPGEGDARGRHRLEGASRRRRPSSRRRPCPGRRGGRRGAPGCRGRARPATSPWGGCLSRWP